MLERLPSADPARGRGERFLLPLGVALVGAFLFRRVLAGEVFYYSDFHQTFVPSRTVLGEALQRGLPLWSGRLRNGEPLLANPVHSALYPPNLICASCDPAAGLSVLAVLHVLAAALGAGFLARRLGRGAIGALVAALAFGFSGGILSAIPVVSVGWSFAWVPWAVVAWLRLAEGVARRESTGRIVGWIALLAGVLAMQILIGEPFGLLASLLGIAVLFGGAPRHRSLGSAGATIAAGGGACLTTLPVLVPVLAYAAVSVRRAGFTLEGMGIWSFHPATAIGFLLPAPFGDPFALDTTRFFARALAPEMGHLYLAGLYLGGLAVALALRGALEREPWRPALLAWLLAGLVLSLGRFGPLFSPLAQVPGFGSIRFPVKWILAAGLPFALLAARGVEALAEGDRARSRLRTFVAFLAVLLPLGAFVLAGPLGLDGRVAALTGRANPAPFVEEVRLRLMGGATASALPLAILLVAFLLAKSRHALRRLPLLALVLIALDLAVQNGRLVTTVGREFYAGAPVAAGLIHRLPAPVGRVHVVPPDPERISFSPPIRRVSELFAWERETLQSYTGAAAGLDLGFDPDIEACSPLAWAQLRKLAMDAPPRERLMTMGAAGITHLVTFEPIPDPRAQLLAVLPNRSNQPLLVYRNLLALPRARIVGRLTPYAGLAGLVRAVRGGEDRFFARTALVEEGELPPGVPTYEGESEARIVDDAGRRVTIETTGAGGWLVVADTFTPGWLARVDGRPTPIFRVDHAFRAMEVPPGRHKVVMSYSPVRGAFPQ